MTSERLAAVQRLFDAAMRVDAARRRAWVEAADAPPATREEVLQLLALDNRAESYFDGLIGAVAGTAAGELQAASRVGWKIGAYRTVREIGRGGMGAVFLAERDDGQFQQQVALKLIRRGMDDEAAVRRFLAERQILARLRHPGIAGLLDGGVSEDGLPYFVMEYVDGAPVTDYCDEHRLGIDDRLRLVVAIGEAVHFAHRNLVIHRDLKPSNVLVDGDGRCRLLDFGIAKLVDDADAAAGPQTATRLLTPLYAAPEQLRGEPVTTATDVYGLGVILYELLAGVRPWEPKGRAARELEREILDSEPPGLAARVDAETAARRSTTVGRLRRRLAGDLDVICRKALHKEPERRYPSVDQLVADIERLLRGQAILARRDTLAYRSWSFVRRHPFGVGTTAGVVLLSLAFGVAMAVQSAHLARERDKAQQVSELMVEMFEVSDPANSRGESPSARSVLDRGVARLAVRLDGQPGLQASLLDVAGRVYQAMGLYDEAAPLLEESLDLRQGGAGSSVEVAESLSHRGELLRLRGELDKADGVLREALDRYRSSGEDVTPAYARTLDRLGVTLLARGEADAAEGLFREALTLNERLHGPDSVDGCENLQNIAAIAYRRGDYPGASELFDRVLSVRRRLLGEDHPQVVATLNNLAAARAAHGDLAAAEEGYREVVALQRRTLGDDHPRLALSLNNLATVLFSTGRTAEAEPLHREALSIRRAKLDPSHPELAQSLSNLGLVLQSLDRLAEAEELLQESLEARRSSLPADHPSVAHSLNNLGLLLLARERPDAALRRFEEALAIVGPALGDHLDVAISYNNMATSLRVLGRYDEAEEEYRLALAMRRRILPANHPHVAHNLVGLGGLLTEVGRPAEAEPLLRDALAIRQTAAAAAVPLAEARGELGVCLGALGRGEEAVSLLRDSLEGYRQALGDEAVPTRRARQRLADAEPVS